MTCVACRAVSRRPLCIRCLRSLRRGGERMADGVLVRSAFEHDGAARLLVHRLKYEAVWGVAPLLAAAMAPLIPPHATALVPVPRTRLRHLRHGVDPAAALAEALGQATGLPVTAVLRAPAWVARRAGAAGRRRGAPRFRIVRPAPAAAVLVDDVVTTGATLVAARRVTGASHAVTATAGRSALAYGAWAT